MFDLFHFDYSMIDMFTTVRFSSTLSCSRLTIDRARDRVTKPSFNHRSAGKNEDIMFHWRTDERDALASISLSLAIVVHENRCLWRALNYHRSPVEMHCYSRFVDRFHEAFIVIVDEYHCSSDSFECRKTSLSRRKKQRERKLVFEWSCSRSLNV